ncbi:MAG: hypothetical protein PVI40_04190 [Chlamydiota bacterium]|jgi:hypothetical protein
MIEVNVAKKIKINLNDYDYEKDIQNRLMMAHFSSFEIEVLEEILFNPTKIPLKRFLNNLDTDLETIQPTLKKLEDMGLLSIQNDTLIIDKEMRKYYEFQVSKFDADFNPDMEFLQGLLRKVPIHVLPTWYSIPRTSNNILASIIEKYLITPQVYQRYLLELKDKDPIFSKIISDVLESKNYKVKASDICQKYELDKVQFEEYMLLLEFSFACCLCYEKEKDEWVEVVTLFHEWKEYLNFLQQSNCLTANNDIKPSYGENFIFVEQMTSILQQLKEKPLSAKQFTNIPSNLINQLLTKLSLIRFINEQEGLFTYSDNAEEWLSMSLEHKALHLYRHPLNHLIAYKGTPEIYTERNQREAEKSILRALHGNWVCFDQFLKGVTVSIGDHAGIQLSSIGKHWGYRVPNYSPDEIDFIHSSIFEGLFEAGMVEISSQEGKDFFRVTSFGRTLFEL